MNGYFESIADERSGYMLEHPRKAEVLKNAKQAGNVTILTGSNNRAVTIETPEKIVLQSYDTIILELDKESRKIRKKWTGYSKTTMNHINSFLHLYNLPTLSKKEWEKL